MLADDYRMVAHLRSHEELSLPVTAFRTAFPDLHKEPIEVIATVENVVIPYIFTGTHENQLMEIPDIGNEVEIAAVAI